MKLFRKLATDDRGAAAIEMAFAVPVLVAMLWIFLQLAQVYRASAGMQQALGQGARFATLCLNPTVLGCSAPSPQDVKNQIDSSVYGIGPGTFNAPLPTTGKSGASQYYDLTVTYTQPTSLLFVPGPTIHITRSKRVWIAAN